MNIGLGLPVTHPTALLDWARRADAGQAGLRTTPGQIRRAVAQFADLGADEVMLYCHGRDPGQVDRLAEIL